MEEEGRYTRITLRIPRDLHSRITRMAFITSKSQNAEIIGRLEASFEDGAALRLPEVVRDAVAREQQERGGTPDEALTRLVMAGQSQGGTVVKISIEPGTTLAQVQAMVGAAAKLLPADAPVLLEGR